ncbi:hypothetical protein [Alteromonas sp. a30]|uniref:hypothetical protein n=1 Tax=Alteromonas sp. a30 TaxID=2730917 RepID=UPI0022830F68|nr:hypothetical protein [Alteromonas sp. a30]MCY7294202.1 hypothetical protein [Alteromonas sp. a30]
MPASDFGIATLLNGIAAEATQTRLQLLRANMPFHMPELGVDLKVALTAGALGARVSLLPASNKNAVAASAIQTRFIALDTPLNVAHPSVVSQAFSGNELTVNIQLFSDSGEAITEASGVAQFPVIEANIDRTLAAYVNDRPLGTEENPNATYIHQPRLSANAQGVYSLKMQVALVDQQARIPLVIDVCGRRQSLLINT